MEQKDGSVVTLILASVVIFSAFTFLEKSKALQFSAVTQHWNFQRFYKNAVNLSALTELEFPAVIKIR